ncbi:MAG: hypothetical protein IKP86_03560 [Anaerolineaceae bacterium]|nr:hypothetical protein [Anaerolineaceae bacterium]
MNTPTIDKYTDLYNEFKQQPAGSPVRVSVSDAEATAAAREYLEANKPAVRDLIRDKAGVSLDIADPVIRFSPDELLLSASGKKGILKVNASANAKITWNGSLNVEAQTVNVPIVSISPEKINPAIKAPLASIMEKVQEYIEIRSFRITDGRAELEGVKK